VNTRRDALLREMGLTPVWRLRAAAAQGRADGSRTVDEAATGGTEGPPPGSSGRSAGASAVATAVEVGAARADAAGTRPTPPAEAPARTAAAPAEAGKERAPHGGAAAAAAADTDRSARISALDWEALEADIRGCTACRLCEQRRQAVPGAGDRQADWMLVGEGPGAEEDRRGEPFVGPAGRLLDAMLAAIGLKRGEGVYIANAVKCRPPFNRTPEPDEIAACLPYLERQIALVRPRLLVALGRPAAQALLGTDIRINAARGKLFSRGGIPVVVTYHPAYLLRNPTDKAKAWQDLCFARRVMADSARS
jgi:DNA polymerase